MSPEILRDTVLGALEDVKGRDVIALDVTGESDVTDWMIVASGTSNTHVKSLVDRVVTSTKATGVDPLGVEGLETQEWVLVDLGDVVVHVMQPTTRQFYDLERLWGADEEAGTEVH